MKVKVAQLCPTLSDPMDCSPWNSPGQNTRVGSLSLLQRIFPTQGLNPGLPHCRWILYQLSPSYDKPRQHIEKQRHHFGDKVHIVKPRVFPLVITDVELDHKEGWAPKNWCFELWCCRSLLSLLNRNEIKRVHPKGNQSWILTGRTDGEAEAPNFGHRMGHQHQCSYLLFN